MQNDEVIWDVINHNFCSFKVPHIKADFCKNEYNVSGLCNRVSCPLANSNYGTIMEHQGTCYLYLKTVERAHSPAKLWERIKLSHDVKMAHKQIDDNMVNVYASHQIYRCKKRLARMHETFITMRKIELKRKPIITSINKKTERRESTREKKAEQAAQIENCIEKELLERLQKGTYGSLYDLSKINETTEEDKNEEDKDQLMQDREKQGELEFVESESEEDLEDMFGSPESEEEQIQKTIHPSLRNYRNKHRPGVQLQYEHEQSTN